MKIATQVWRTPGAYARSFHVVEHRGACGHFFIVADPCRRRKTQNLGGSCMIAPRFVVVFFAIFSPTGCWSLFGDRVWGLSVGWINRWEGAKKVGGFHGVRVPHAGAGQIAVGLAPWEPRLQQAPEVIGLVDRHESQGLQCDIKVQAVLRVDGWHWCSYL